MPRPVWVRSLLSCALRILRSCGSAAVKGVVNDGAAVLGLERAVYCSKGRRGTGLRIPRRNPDVTKSAACRIDYSRLPVPDGCIGGRWKFARSGRTASAGISNRACMTESVGRFCQTAVMPPLNHSAVRLASGCIVNTDSRRGTFADGERIPRPFGFGYSAGGFNEAYPKVSVGTPQARF